MKVKAIQKGFDGICVREVGEVFEWPHKKPGEWMTEVGTEKKENSNRAKPTLNQDKIKTADATLARENDKEIA